MKNKKVVLSVLSATVVSSMATSAMAAPDYGVYLGGDVDKYYNLEYFVSQDFLDAFNADLESLGDNFAAVVYVDEEGKAANLEAMGEAANWEDALEEVTEDNVEEIFGDSASDLFEVIGEDGEPTGETKDTGFGGEVDEPTVGDDVEATPDGNKVVITGTVEHANDVRITVNGTTEYLASEGQFDEFDEETGAFTLTIEDLEAGEYDYSVVAIDSENEVESDAFEDTFTIDAPAQVEVESVSAINAKTLVVDFSKELTAEDKAKVTYEVKKDGAVQLFKLDSYDADKAKLVKTSGSNLEAGTYTVTVKGLAEGAENTGTVTVEAQKATTLEVAGTELLDANAKAKVNVVLKDQYGEALSYIGSDFSIAAFNKTQAKSVTLGFDGTDKYFFIDTKTVADDFKQNDEIVVTIMHNGSSLKATQTLKVVGAAGLESLEFGTIELPAGKTLLTQDLTNVKVPYTAKDQYGNDLAVVIGDFEVISTDTGVIAKSDVELITDTDKKVKLNVKKFGKAGKSTITLFHKTTGKTASVTFDVSEKAGTIYDIEAEKNAVAIAQGGSPAYVALIVTDKYGNKIDPKDYAPIAATTFTFNTSNASIVKQPTIVAATDPTNPGKLKIEAQTGATKGQTATVSVTVNATGERFDIAVTIGEASVPSLIDIKKDTTVVSHMLTGAKQEVKFDVKDQYGTALSATAGYTVKYTTSDATVLAISSTEAGDAIDNGAVTLDAKKAGSATVTAQLVKDGTTVLDTESFTITVGQNNSGQVTYNVADIPSLYKKAEVDVASGTSDTEMKAKVDAGYAKEVKITATDATGNTYVVPSSAIVSIKSDNAGVIVAKSTDDKYYVTTDDVTIPTPAADVVANLIITINAEDTVKTLVKPVTVSKHDLAPASVSFKDLAPSVANEATAKDVDALTLENAAEYVGDIAAADASKTAYLWIKDQFGGYTLSAGPNGNDANNISLNLVPVDGVSNTSDDSVALSATQDGKLTVADGSSNTSFTKNDAKFRVVAVNGSFSDFINVTVTDGAKPVITSAVMTTDADATPDSKYGSVGDVLTLTFSENVSLALTDTSADSTTGYFDMDATEFAAVTGLTGTGGAFAAKVVDGNKVEIKVVTSAITTPLVADGTVNAVGTANAKVKDTATNAQAAATGVKLTK